jgi:hypothetical protein
MSNTTPQCTNYTRVDVDNGTGTSTAGAATVNTQVGQITTEALATAAGATYTFTLTNSLIRATSTVLPTVGRGTATTGGLTPIYVTPAAGSCVMIFQNVTLAAVNGTVTIGFAVFNMA